MGIRVKFNVAFAHPIHGAFSVGQVAELVEELARELISKGYCELLTIETGVEFYVTKPTDATNYGRETK